jgi:phthiodiolone/phenolphthiodiolone dimycocerosates ketoreductase
MKDDERRMKDVVFSGTPDEVIGQVAERRGHGLRYPLVINNSLVNSKLRKTLAASLPHTQVPVGFKKL